MFDQSTRLCDVKYKIVLLGPTAVGKSAIIQRFTQQTFDQSRGETVGIDFIMKNIIFEGLVYKLQLWDTAGQQKFRSLIPAYIRDAHCAVFVFDLSNKLSFQMVDTWVELFSDFKNDSSIMILVGNKLDNQDNREVTEEEAQAKADNYHMSYCQTSAKTNRGVTELFHSIISNIRVNRNHKKSTTEKSTEQSENEQPSFSQRSINKTKLVKIKRQDERRLSCCYI